MGNNRFHVPTPFWVEIIQVIAECELTKKTRGRVETARGSGRCAPPQKITFFEFSSKNAGFYAFY